MSQPTISEALVVDFFAAHGIRCTPVPTRHNVRTPDFVIELATPVVCEVKQIDPNDEDRREVEQLRRATTGDAQFSGRWIPDRIWPLLSNAKGQFQRVSREEQKPTLLIIYDATPFKAYTGDTDIMQAMFGRLSVTVWVDATGETRHTDTYWGGKRFFTPNMNTSFSGVGLLAEVPGIASLSLTIYHNPFARVPLDPRLFDGLPVTHKR